MKKLSNIASYRKALSDKHGLVQLRALRISQLENDLNAAKRREEMHRESDLKLADRINVLINQQRLTDACLQQMTDERNDWRDAFKLIMRLVK